MKTPRAQSSPQHHSQGTLHPFHSILPSWISTSLSHKAFATGPIWFPAYGGSSISFSSPCQPIRETAVTTAAVPTQNASSSVPSWPVRTSSGMVIVRSCVCKRVLFDRYGSEVSFPWAVRRSKVEARVTPGSMVPSSGGVTTSRSIPSQSMTAVGPRHAYLRRRASVRWRSSLRLLLWQYRPRAKGFVDIHSQEQHVEAWTREHSSHLPTQ